MGKSLIGKEFDSETAYGDNDRYINSKLKSFGDKVNTRSQDEKNTKKKCIIQMFVIDNARFLNQIVYGPTLAIYY